MHIVHKLLNLLVLLPLSLGVVHAQGESETFSNPVFAHDWPDPTIWQGDDSLYYTFSTAGTNYAKGLGKFLWSEDMVTWDTIPDYVWTSQTLSQLKQYGSSLVHLRPIPQSWCSHSIPKHFQLAKVCMAPGRWMGSSPVARRITSSTPSIHS